MTSRLKLGLVGVGPWGQYILRDLKNLDVEVHAAVRTEASRRRAIAGEANSIVGDPAELPECAGYVVANQTAAHLDAVEALLPRRRPIFVEKPLSNDVGRARRLPHEAQNLVFTMHKWRYHPGVIELARIAATQEFGPVRGLRTHRLGWGLNHADVNSIWILLPHDLSIALHILGGMPHLVDVWRDPLTQDDGLLLRGEAKGIDFVAEISSGSPQKYRNIVLSCRDAACQLSDTHYDRIIIRRTGTPETAAPEMRQIGNDMPLFRELQHFVEHLKGGPAPMTCLSEEIGIMEVLAEAQKRITG